MPLPHLLVIDDNVDLRHAFVRVFSRHFAAVSTADAETALAAIDAGALCDVILCDLNLRRMSGHDFYDELKSRAHALATRLVIITGEDPPEDDAFAKELGKRYLRKPCEISDMIATLRRVAFPRLSPSSAPEAAAE